MSRVGKKPIEIPEKTEVSIKNQKITVKGPNGSLTRDIHPYVGLEEKDRELRVNLLSTDRKHRPFQGLYRSLIANMVTGVSKGFERVLEINGIGYRATLNGKTLVLNLGFSHPVNYDLPEGIAAKVNKNNDITLSGIDKELLGRTAAAIRKLRPPEPYKGKGVKYAEERIRKKAGKTGAV